MDLEVSEDEYDMSFQDESPSPKKAEPAQDADLSFEDLMAGGAIGKDGTHQSFNDKPPAGLGMSLNATEDAFADPDSSPDVLAESQKREATDKELVTIVKKLDRDIEDCGEDGNIDSIFGLNGAKDDGAHSKPANDLVFGDIDSPGTKDEDTLSKNQQILKFSKHQQDTQETFKTKPNNGRAQDSAAGGDEKTIENRTAADSPTMEMDVVTNVETNVETLFVDHKVENASQGSKGSKRSKTSVGEKQQSKELSQLDKELGLEQPMLPPTPPILQEQKIDNTMDLTNAGTENAPVLESPVESPIEEIAGDKPAEIPTGAETKPAETEKKLDSKSKPFDIDDLLAQNAALLAEPDPPAQQPPPPTSVQTATADAELTDTAGGMSAGGASQTDAGVAPPVSHTEPMSQIDPPLQTEVLNESPVVDPSSPNLASSSHRRPDEVMSHTNRSNDGSPGMEKSEKKFVEKIQVTNYMTNLDELPPEPQKKSESGSKEAGGGSAEKRQGSPAKSVDEYSEEFEPDSPVTSPQQASQVDDLVGDVKPEEGSKELQKSQPELTPALPTASPERAGTQQAEDKRDVRAASKPPETTTKPTRKPTADSASKPAPDSRKPSGLKDSEAVHLTGNTKEGSNRGMNQSKNPSKEQMPSKSSSSNPPRSGLGSKPGIPNSASGGVKKPTPNNAISVAAPNFTGDPAPPGARRQSSKPGIPSFPRPAPAAATSSAPTPQQMPPMPPKNLSGSYTGSNPGNPAGYTGSNPAATGSGGFAHKAATVMHTYHDPETGQKKGVILTASNAQAVLGQKGKGGKMGNRMPRPPLSVPQKVKGGRGKGQRVKGKGGTGTSGGSSNSGTQKQTGGTPKPGSREGAVASRGQSPTQVGPFEAGHQVVPKTTPHQYPETFGSPPRSPRTAAETNDRMKDVYYNKPSPSTSAYGQFSGEPKKPSPRSDDRWKKSPTDTGVDVSKASPMDLSPKYKQVAKEVELCVSGQGGRRPDAVTSPSRAKCENPEIAGQSRATSAKGRAVTPRYEDHPFLDQHYGQEFRDSNTKRSSSTRREIPDYIRIQRAINKARKNQVIGELQVMLQQTWRREKMQKMREVKLDWRKKRVEALEHAEREKKAKLAKQAEERRIYVEKQQVDRDRMNRRKQEELRIKEYDTERLKQLQFEKVMQEKQRTVDRAAKIRETEKTKRKPRVPFVMPTIY